jgi:hypothetical protein
VSHQFPIGTWAPDKTIHVEDKDLPLWTIPRVELKSNVERTNDNDNVNR